MKRRQFLRHASTLPLLGGGIAAATAVKSETSVKAQIEAHAAEIRRLLEGIAPEGTGHLVCRITPSGFDAQTCEGGIHHLNPHSMAWF